MSAVSTFVERHHRSIIVALVVVILFFVFACVFDNVIPVCHWLFKCDHAYHSSVQLIRAVVPL